MRHEQFAITKPGVSLIQTGPEVITGGRVSGMARRPGVELSPIRNTAEDYGAELHPKSRPVY